MVVEIASLDTLEVGSEEEMYLANMARRERAEKRARKKKAKVLVFCLHGPLVAQYMR